MKIENYSQKSNSNSSELIVNGSYNSKSCSIRYRIKVKQTKKSSFARTVVKIDDEKPVEITTEESPDGKLKTRYVPLAKNSSATHSEDHLKTSITKIIDAIHYKNKDHMPLITNSESYFIYALQERLRELLFSRNHIEN
jgi:hypothetical protein